MTVFLDTNVLVSAFASRGLCADVLRLVLSQHELILSQQVITEFHRVLKMKFRVRDALLAEFTAFFDESHIVPIPQPPFPHEVRDTDDAAIHTQCEILVTGDPDLLDMASAISELRILSPRQFWELQKQGT
ncbi:MAG: putative toxin-antitoxin system toxin component, PIN family [Bacteroidota bacterium]